MADCQGFESDARQLVTDALIGQAVRSSVRCDHRSKSASQQPTSETVAATATNCFSYAKPCLCLGPSLPHQVSAVTEETRASAVNESRRSIVAVLRSYNELAWRHLILHLQKVALFTTYSASRSQHLFTTISNSPIINQLMQSFKPAIKIF